MKPWTARTAIALALLAGSLSCGGGEGSTGPSSNPVPTLTSLSRDTAMAGATPFVITLRGTGFVPGISATIGGVARTTTRTSDTVATVQTIAADLATATTREVRVINPEPGGGTSAPLILTIHPAPPSPVLDSLTPDSTSIGSPATVLHAYGSGFIPSTKIRWDGVDLTTTFHSSTHLSTSLPAARFTALGTAAVTLRTPAPGGGTSGTLPFLVTVDHRPVIVSTDPDTIVLRADTIVVTVRGTNLIGADTVLLSNNAVNRKVVPYAVTDTSFAFDLDLTWLIAASPLSITPHAATGTAAQIYFLPLRNPPPPALTSVDPDSIDPGPDTVVVTARGLRLTGADSIRLSHNLTTRGVVPTAVTDTSLSFSLDRTWLISGQKVQVTVRTPEGVSTPPLEIYVRTPPFSLTGLSRDTLDAWSGADTVTVTGTGFGVGFFASIDGTEIYDRAWVSPNELLLVIYGEMKTKGGVSHIFVSDDFGAGRYDSLPLPVRTLTPVLDSLNATDADSVGLEGRAVAIWGANFAARGKAMVDGVEVPYTFHTPDRIDLHLLDPAFFAAPDTFAITFVNPEPTTGTANALPFAVLHANPVPTLASVDRTFLPADSGDITITLKGGGFLPTTFASARGPFDIEPPTPLQSLRLNDSTLEVTVPSAILGSPTPLLVLARNPAPTAGTSEVLHLRRGSPGLRTLRSRPGHVVEIAYDSTRGRLLVIMDDEVSGAGTLLAIDPLTGTTLDSLELSGRPREIGIAANGAHLFVSLEGEGIATLNPDPLAVESVMPLYFLGGPFSGPHSMRMVPGSNDAIVVQRLNTGGPNVGYEIVSIQGGLIGPATVPLGGDAAAFAFLAPDTIVVLSTGSGPRLAVYAVDGNGLQLVRDTALSESWGTTEIAVHGQFVFSNRGPVFDLATGAVVGGIDDEGYGVTFAQGRGPGETIVASGGYVSGGDFTNAISRFGAGDASRDEQVAFPWGLDPPRSVVLWGTSGFAVGGWAGLNIGTSNASD